METVLVVGKRGRLVSRLRKLLADEICVESAEDAGEALSRPDRLARTQLIISRFHDWPPDALAALQREYPRIPRIDLISRRTRRELHRSLLEEGHFAALTESAPDLEWLHVHWQARVRSGAAADYRMEPVPESVVSESAAVQAPPAEDLLLMMAHDVRIAISVVSGYAGLLLEHAPEALPEGNMMLRRIRDTGAHLVGLVDDIARIALLGGGHAALQCEPATPAELIHAAVEDLAGAIEARQHTVLQHAAPGGQARSVDRHLVALVLRNLLDNAVKYTAPGGRIEISGRHTKTGLHFEVRDNGRGIAPEHLEAIFERMTRFPRGTHEKGSGLGLWAAKTVVELHGGRIWAESAPGQGTVFRFEVKAFPHHAETSR